MKWLILSCTTKAEQRRAAYAITEAAQKRGIVCQTADPGQAWNKTRNRGSFDAALCTQLSGMEVITAARKQYGKPLPCFGVFTEYTCLPFSSEISLDAYFVPHEDLIPGLMKKGWPSGQLIPTGIPVASVFSSPIGRESARNALVIPEKKRIYLILSDGMEYEHLQGICDQFLETEEEGCTVYALVGRDDERLERLQKRYQGLPQMQVIAFTNKVHLFMQAADVVIGSPAGLSLTEAAVLGMPLIHLADQRGERKENAAFFADRGLSLCAGTPTDSVKKARALAENRDVALRMRGKQRQFAKPDAAEAIVNRILRHVT